MAFRSSATRGVIFVGRCMCFPVHRHYIRGAVLVDGHMLLNASEADWSVCPWHQFLVRRFILFVRILRYYYKFWPLNRYFLVRFEYGGFAYAFTVIVITSFLRCGQSIVDMSSHKSQYWTKTDTKYAVKYITG